MVHYLIHLLVHLKPALFYNLFNICIYDVDYFFQGMPNHGGMGGNHGNMGGSHGGMGAGNQGGMGAGNQGGNFGDAPTLVTYLNQLLSNLNSLIPPKRFK